MEVALTTHMCYRLPPVGDAIRKNSIESLVKTLVGPFTYLEVITADESPAGMPPLHVDRRDSFRDADALGADPGLFRVSRTALCRMTGAALCSCRVGLAP